MEVTQKEEFMICPCCGEEAFVTLARGFNLVDCPYCAYFFIAYRDEADKTWTRELGVLATDSQ